MTTQNSLAGMRIEEEELAAARLWHLLDDATRYRLYREFFTQHWSDLADLMEEHEESMNRLHNSQSLGLHFRQRWQRWRDAKMNRLAEGEEFFSHS